MSIENTARAVFLLGVLYLLFRWRDLFLEPPEPIALVAIVMIFLAFGVLLIIRLFNTWAWLKKRKNKGHNNGR